VNTEPSCSIKCETVLGYMSDPQLFRKNCAQCNGSHCVYICPEWREVTARVCVCLFLPAFRDSSGHSGHTSSPGPFCVPSYLSFPRPFPSSLPKFCVRYFKCLPLELFTFVELCAAFSFTPLAFRRGLKADIPMLVSSYPPPPPRGRVFGYHRLSCFVSGYGDKSSDCEDERLSLFCPLFFPK